MKEIDEFEQLADGGQVQWSEQPTPKPTAMRSFMGVSEKYTALVVQARIAEEDRVMCLAVLNIKSGQPFAIVKLNAELAEKLYNLARAACPPLTL